MIRMFAAALCGALLCLVLIESLGYPDGGLTRIFAETVAGNGTDARSKNVSSKEQARDEAAQRAKAAQKREAERQLDDAITQQLLRDAFRNR